MTEVQKTTGSLHMTRRDTAQTRGNLGDAPECGRVARPKRGDAGRSAPLRGTQRKKRKSLNSVPGDVAAPGGSARRWVVKKRIRNAVSARRPFPPQPRGRGRLRADAGQTLMHQGGEPWARRPGTERVPPTERTSPAPRSAAPLGFVPRALLVLRRDFITPAAL